MNRGREPGRRTRYRDSTLLRQPRPSRGVASTPVRMFHGCSAEPTKRRKVRRTQLHHSGGPHVVKSACLQAIAAALRPLPTNGRRASNPRPSGLASYRSTVFGAATLPLNANLADSSAVSAWPDRVLPVRTAAEHCREHHSLTFGQRSERLFLGQRNRTEYLRRTRRSPARLV